jgi:hypothetical protein
LGVVGRLRVEAGEELEGGGKIAGGERVVGLLDEGGLRCGLGVGVREVLRRDVGGENGAQESRDEREALEAGGARLGCRDWRGRSFRGEEWIKVEGPGVGRVRLRGEYSRRVGARRA